MALVGVRLVETVRPLTVAANVPPLTSVPLLPTCVPVNVQEAATAQELDRAAVHVVLEFKRPTYLVGGGSRAYNATRPTHRPIVRDLERQRRRGVDGDEVLQVQPAVGDDCARSSQIRRSVSLAVDRIVVLKVRAARVQGAVNDHGASADPALAPTRMAPLSWSAVIIPLFRISRRGDYVLYAAVATTLTPGSGDRNRIDIKVAETGHRRPGENAEIVEAVTEAWHWAGWVPVPGHSERAGGQTQIPRKGIRHFPYFSIEPATHQTAPRSSAKPQPTNRCHRNF